MAKRRKLNNAPRTGKPHRPSIHSKYPKSPKSTDQTSKQPLKKKHRQTHHIEPTIPFDSDDHILLIGEGDLSFAASLIKHHACVNVTATVLDKDHAELVAKYPSVDTNIAIINNEALPLPAQEQETASDSETTSPTAELQPDIEPSDEEGTPKSPRVPKNKLLYNIDATKFPSTLTRHKPPFTRIFFNFPHVGGKSTDVNRQVRYNQSLLVSFFKAALPALAPGGSIIVTLFEGEPYTLWNVKDLARHSGLQVDTSFKFLASVYPEYRHARTLGVVKNKQGQEGGGWKGEERPSRSYVFMRKGDIPARPEKKKKRSRDDDASSDEN